MWCARFRYMTLFNTIANLGSKWTNTAFFSAVAFYADYARAEPSHTLESELVCTEWAGTALPRTCARVLTTKIAPMAKVLPCYRCFSCHRPAQAARSVERSTDA